MIYLDNTPGGVGKDTNNGLTPGSAVATFAKAKSLVRSGYPDWILIKRGTTHNQAITNWNLSGRSAAEPLVIGSYGDPAAARPKFVTGSAVHGFSTETPPKWMMPSMPLTIRSTAAMSARSAATNCSSLPSGFGSTMSLKRSSP